MILDAINDKSYNERLSKSSLIFDACEIRNQQGL